MDAEVHDQIEHGTQNSDLGQIEERCQHDGQPRGNEQRLIPRCLLRSPALTDVAERGLELGYGVQTGKQTQKRDNDGNPHGDPIPHSLGSEHRLSSLIQGIIADFNKL